MYEISVNFAFESFGEMRRLHALPVNGSHPHSRGGYNYG